MNGCLLYWKQEIWRRIKVKGIGIRDEQVSMTMTRNVMDILTIIPRGEIATKGIPFVIYILEPNLGAEDLEKWGKFWTYLNSYWLSSIDFVATWNIHNKDENYFDLENRINNDF